MLHAIFEEIRTLGHYNIFFVALSVLLARLVSTHTLWERDPGTLFSSGSTWGDLPFHLNIISSLCYGPNSRLRLGTWKSLIYSGDNLVYPLLADYHSALLVKGGFNLRWSILLPNVLLLLSLVHILFSLSVRFASLSTQSAKRPFRPEYVGMFAVLLTLFSGGVAFHSFPSDWLLSGHPLSLGSFFASWQKNWVHFTNKAERFWFQTITDMLLPQRAAALALPLALGTYLNLWLALISSEHKGPERRMHMFLAGVLAGSLPFCQGHSFLAIIITSAVLFVLFAREPYTTYVGEWALFGLTVSVLALPQMWFLSSRAHQWGFAKLCPVWDGALCIPILEVTPSAVFDALIQLHIGLYKASILWYHSLGLFGPFSLLALLILNPKQLKFFLAFWAVLVVGTLVQFQPWKLDNVKIIVSWHMVASAAVGLLLERIRSFGKGLHWKVVAYTFLTLLTLSAVLCVARETHLQWPLYAPHDTEVAAWVRSHTSVDAVFLTGDSHRHPVSSLGGRIQVMGYKGWLWSHGYNFGGRAEDVGTMLRGGPDIEPLLKKYAVEYIVLGPHERRDYQANTTFFQQTFPLIFRSSDYNEHSGFEIFELPKR
eukprot:CAMPEP_0184660452 /NCGR_PEP_ID=MMETSP0308-20130426/34000_1 /TAXON_ID=38269 /ORGANISM="Gloeochaete witrockiana, Strain SAG 46.84" /LENGTH=597 /DNA_ID=CAMNT_0027101065 /DNA_START=280 /DNA_END=2073 /DNA_ORIENTATION=+